MYPFSCSKLIISFALYSQIGLEFAEVARTVIVKGIEA
jgi:hypothetical protein